MNNNYENELQYLPNNLRAFLQEPNRVHKYPDLSFTRLFEGYDYLAVLNNVLASNVASGFTEMNKSYLMSGIAPRLLEILTNKIVNKCKIVAEGKEEIIDKAIKPAYFTKKLKQAFRNAIRTGANLLTLYEKGDEKKQGLKIQNVNCFRHRVEIVDDEITNAYIFCDLIKEETYNNYIFVEHRFYDNENKPKYENYIQFTCWEINKEKKERVNLKDIRDNDVVQWLEKHKDIVFDKVLDLPFNDLGCYRIDATDYNSKFPNSQIPESRFVNVQDTIQELETSHTYKEIDKNIGRGRAMIPQQFMANPNVGMVGGKTNNLAGTGAFNNPMDTTYFVKYQSNAGNRPDAIQFNLRAQEWRILIEGEVADICAAFGISIMSYDPRLLQTGNRTDDEISSMNDLEIATAEELRGINEDSINKMIEQICIYYGVEIPAVIQWQTLINPSKQADLVQKKLTMGLISRKKALKELYPDLPQAEIDEELNKINSERGNEEIIF